MLLLPSGRTKARSSGEIFTPNTVCVPLRKQGKAGIGTTVSVATSPRVLRRPCVPYRGTAGKPVLYPCRSARTPARTARSRTHHNFHTRPYVAIVGLRDIFFAQNYSMRNVRQQLASQQYRYWFQAKYERERTEVGWKSPTGNRESPGPPRRRQQARGSANARGILAHIAPQHHVTLAHT
jgi:hypothetical protein